MRRLAIVLIILIAASLACNAVQIQDPLFQDEPAETPDGLATVLAEAAQVTQKVAASATAAPTATDEPMATAAEDSEMEETPEAEETSEPTATATDTGYPTAIPLPDPRAENFATCVDECLSDGSNHQTSFQEKIELIHFRFEFEEFPVKAPYTRTWYRDGELWVHYSCLWPGPEEGVEEITLTDPLGLPSGSWNVVIVVNGEQVLDESLTIEGNWNQWTPPGYFNSCYGKR
jgi:hypothetical protein